MKATDHVPRQQRQLFLTAAEQRRAERLERVAQLATLPKVSTAARWFDDDGERAALQRASRDGVGDVGG